MAKGRKPSPRPDMPKGTADDAFTARLLEFVGWARNRTEVLVGVVVVLVVVVVGGIYYWNQRGERLQQASMELEAIHQTVPLAPFEEVRQELDQFLARYGGTPYAVEARLVYAEILLEEERPGEAVEVLREVAPAYRSSLGLQATFLLAVAYEAQEAWEDAGRIYAELEDRGEFAFQRREAAEGLARTHLAQDDSASAIEVYRRLVESTEGDPELQGYFEMRLAELTRGQS